MTSRHGQLLTHHHCAVSQNKRLLDLAGSARCQRTVFVFVALAQLPMEFQDLCTFETFQQLWSHYGYEGKLEDMIEQEFSRTKGKMFECMFWFCLQNNIYFMKL